MLGLVSASYGQERIAPKNREQVEIKAAKSTFHLYLMVGQSNMAGNNPVEAVDTLPDVRVLRLNKQNAWEIAKEPLRIDKDITGVSPGLAFAKRLRQEDATVTIGLIPSAVGGTSIDLWQPGAFDPKTQMYPYDQALARTKIAMQSGSLRGIIWHQGESDSNPEKAEGYARKLKNLIVQFRADLNNDTLPFVAGLLPSFQTRKKPEGKIRINPSVEVINRAILQLRDEVDRYEVVLLEGATHQGDWTHLDALSERRLGREYAEAMVNMTEQTH